MLKEEKLFKAEDLFVVFLNILRKKYWAIIIKISGRISLISVVFPAQGRQ